jgi:hypothetical protein
MVVRNDRFEIERIEQLPLIPAASPHHRRLRRCPILRDNDRIIGGRTPQRTSATKWVRSGQSDYLNRVAIGFATSRAHSMKSFAVGFNTRFFSVKIPIGPLWAGNTTGNFLMNGCRIGNCSQNSGRIER